MTPEQAYAAWLKRQKELEPALPIRTMAEIIHTGHKTVQRLIKQLKQQGLIEELDYGNKKQYRMIEK